MDKEELKAEILRELTDYFPHYTVRMEYGGEGMCGVGVFGVPDVSVDSVRDTIYDLEQELRCAEQGVGLVALVRNISVTQKHYPELMPPVRSATEPKLEPKTKLEAKAIIEIDRMCNAGHKLPLSEREQKLVTIIEELCQTVLTNAKSTDMHELRCAASLTRRQLHKLLTGLPVEIPLDPISRDEWLTDIPAEFNSWGKHGDKLTELLEARKEGTESRNPAIELDVIVAHPPCGDPAPHSVARGGRKPCQNKLTMIMWAGVAKSK